MFEHLRSVPYAETPRPSITLESVTNDPVSVYGKLYCSSIVGSTPIASRAAVQKATWLCSSKYMYCRLTSSRSEFPFQDPSLSHETTWGSIYCRNMSHDSKYATNQEVFGWRTPTIEWVCEASGHKVPLSEISKAPFVECPLQIFYRQKVVEDDFITDNRGGDVGNQ